MTRSCAFTLTLQLLTTLVSGQLTDIQYDKIYFRGKEDYIRSIIILSDGRLVAVGETMEDRNGRDGLLLLVDPADGQLITSKVFPRLGDNAFLDVAEADDGSLYLVGYTEDNKTRDPWLVRLDEDFRTIDEDIQDLPGENYYEKIVWLENGTGLIAGWKKPKKEGNIWLRGIDWNGYTGLDKEVGYGAFGDLVEMELGAGEQVWLCGNTQKSRLTGRGNSWMIRVDDQGDVVSEKILGGKSYEELHCATTSVFGHFVMAGEKVHHYSDFSDPWIIEFNSEGRQVLNEVKPSDLDQSVSGIYKVPRGDLWASVQSLDPNSSLPVHQLMLADSESAGYPFDLEEDQQFEVLRLMPTYYHQFLLVGNMNEGRKGNSGLRIVAFTEEHLLASKTGPSVIATEPTLNEETEDGILEPGERAAMTFYIENIGDTDIPQLTASSFPGQEAAAFKLHRPRIFIPYLPAGQRRKVSISLTGTDMVNRDTRAGFDISIKAERQEIASIAAQIENSGQPEHSFAAPMTLPGVKLTWLQPRVIASGSREFATTQPSYNIQLDISTQQPITVEEPEIYLNARPVPDSTDKSRTLTEPVQEGGWLDYSFSFEVTGLEEGRNEISVRLGDFETNVIINYEARKPNLHILAIAPTYQDLDYTVKDARDFVHVLAEQENRGFFDRVFIDTLLQPDNTNKTSIQIAFAKLHNRFVRENYPDHIEPNDYVMVFISAHGMKYNGGFHLLPTDYQPDLKELTLIDYQQSILNELQEIDCKKILFIDACQSGAAKGARTVDPADLNRALIRANSSVPGLVTFSSSSASQLSFEDKAWQNGAFTEALLEAFTDQEVQLRDGTVIRSNSDQSEAGHGRFLTIGELEYFLRKRVPDLVKRIKKNVRQVPTVTRKELDADIPLLIVN